MWSKSSSNNRVVAIMAGTWIETRITQFFRLEKSSPAVLWYTKNRAMQEGEIFSKRAAWAAREKVDCKRKATMRACRRSKRYLAL